MSTVVVTGAAGDLGRRVVAALTADPSVDRVVAVDREPAGNPSVTAVDLASADLKEVFAGATAVIHLAISSGFEEVPSSGDVLATQRVLDAAGSVGASQVVVRSSALVYGAWANNPVPLTENAPIRPNPGLAWSAERAEIERLIGEFAEGHPSVATAVLRPVPCVADDRVDWLAASLRANALIGAGHDDDPPHQYLHIDDLAAAALTAWRSGADGVFNVAPDGWIPGETVRALAGGLPKLRLPAPLATRLTAWRWRWRLAPTPPGLVPYTMHPWVVANDRLRALGWEPAHTNEEAYVTGHASTPWDNISPRRRQELALAISAAVLGGIGVGGIAVYRRRSRRS